jgi:hypothetical protein
VSKHEQVAAIREMRGKIWSPGRPSTARRQHRVGFWEAIARGLTSEGAAAEVGMSSAFGTKSFRDAGGMPSLKLVPLSGRFLSFEEREEIAVLHAQRQGAREIARRMGRSPSTISRELRRNASTRSNELTYRASTAQWHAERRQRDGGMWRWRSPHTRAPRRRSQPMRSAPRPVPGTQLGPGKRPCPSDLERPSGPCPLSRPGLDSRPLPQHARSGSLDHHRLREIWVSTALRAHGRGRAGKARRG